MLQLYGFSNWKISTPGSLPRPGCTRLVRAFNVQTLMDQIDHTWHLYIGPFSSSANNILPFSWPGLLANPGGLARISKQQVFPILSSCCHCPPSSSIEAANMNRELMSLIISRQKNCTRGPESSLSANLRSRMFDWWNNYKIKQIWFISLM